MRSAFFLYTSATGECINVFLLEANSASTVIGLNFNFQGAHLCGVLLGQFILGMTPD